MAAVFTVVFTHIYSDRVIVHTYCTCTYTVHVLCDQNIALYAGLLSPRGNKAEYEASQHEID